MTTQNLHDAISFIHRRDYTVMNTTHIGDRLIIVECLTPANVSKFYAFSNTDGNIAYMHVWSDSIEHLILTALCRLNLDNNEQLSQYIFNIFDHANSAK